MRYLHNENHLKECHVWLILKGISQNTAFHLFSRSNTFLDTVRRIDMRKIWLVSFKPFPGESDGQMTMEYHGLPWSTMVVHGHTTMVNHG